MRRRLKFVWVYFMIVLWEGLRRWAEAGHTKWRIALDIMDGKAHFYHMPKTITHVQAYEPTEVEK